MPTSVLVACCAAQTRTIDFATSNLRGSPVDLYLGGARIEASYPMGPRAGVPVNVTMMSYCGELHLGINSDPAAIVDPDSASSSTAFASSRFDGRPLGAATARRTLPDCSPPLGSLRLGVGRAGQGRRRAGLGGATASSHSSWPGSRQCRCWHRAAAVDDVEVQRRRVVGELEDLARPRDAAAPSSSRSASATTESTRHRQSGHAETVAARDRR